MNVETLFNQVRRRIDIYFEVNLSKNPEIQMV